LSSGEGTGIVDNAIVISARREDVMEAIWQWGIELIHSIQVVHGPTLDAVFKAITFMGEEEFLLVLLPLVLWCVDFPAGTRLSIVYLLSVYVNEGLKGLFAHPRPFVLDPTVKLHEIEGYGLPSGHAQSAVVVWGILAAEFRKRWMWVVAVLLMVLIGFSRVYLGVHFPTDVLAGWVIGVVFLVGYLVLVPRAEAWLRETGLVVRLALAVVLPLMLLLLYSSDGSAAAMGVLMGACVGIEMTHRFVPFSAAGPLWQRAMRLIVGAVIVMALRIGLKALFPAEGEPLYFAMRTVRYAVVGLWAGLGAPWLFLKLRLAPAE
jgi:membrane-associated phospholipid phosphatase